MPVLPVAFSVLDFGAVGDGVFDDAAAIQAAVNAARGMGTTFGGGGARITFPPGRVFHCDAPLNLDHAVSITLEGEAAPEGLGLGPTASTLNHALTGPGAFLSARGSQGCTFRNLRIMNLSAAWTGTMIDGSGFGSDTSGLVVDRCHLQAAAASAATGTVGVRLCQAIKSRVVGTQFSWLACGVLGVDQAGYSNANQVLGCQFESIVSNAAIRNAGQGWLIGWNCFEPNVAGQACGYEDDLTYGAYGPVAFLANWFGDATAGAAPWIRYRGNGLSSHGDFFGSPGAGQACILVGSSSQAIQGVAISGSQFEGPFAVRVTGAGQVFGFVMSGCHATGGWVDDPGKLLNNPRYIGNDSLADQLGAPVTIPAAARFGPIAAIPGGVPYASIGTIEPGVPGAINGELAIVSRGDGGGGDYGVAIFAGDALQLPIARFRRNAGAVFYRPVVLPELAAPLKNSLSVDPKSGALVFVDRNGTIHPLT